MRNLIRRTDRISKAPEQDRQRDSGGGMMRDMITGNISRESIPQGIMDNPIVGTIMEGFDLLEPYVPEKIDTAPGMSGDFYGYEAPVGPGILTFGADRDLENIYSGYQFSFDDGGLATLTGDLEQRMTTPDPQNIEPKKLTDEQKDYLMDYMLDFMFKQKQREQMEKEGNMPRFNYFDMEV
jgi:hypothetical protein